MDKKNNYLPDDIAWGFKNRQKIAQVKSSENKVDFEENKVNEVLNKTISAIPDDIAWGFKPQYRSVLSKPVEKNIITNTRSKFEDQCTNIIHTLFGIRFENNVKLPELTNPGTGHELELDLYNSEYRIAFECQGIRHYESIDGDYEAYLKGRERDRLKEKLCMKNKIKLYYIPYWYRTDYELTGLIKFYYDYSIAEYLRKLEKKERIKYYEFQEGISNDRVNASIHNPDHQDGILRMGYKAPLNINISN